MKAAQMFLSESQELFYIYEDLFKQDFKKEISFKSKGLVEEEAKQTPKPEDKETEIKELQEKPDRDPELYKIYKKIVMKTHPDRTGNENFVDVFNQATDAMNRNDWISLVNIATSLKIKTPKLTKELRHKIKNNIIETNKKIKNLQNTTAWVWANAPQEDKDLIRIHIRKIMGINEEAFQEYLKSTQE